MPDWRDLLTPGYTTNTTSGNVIPFPRPDKATTTALPPLEHVRRTAVLNLFKTEEGKDT